MTLQVKKLLESSALNLRTLAQRLSVQLSATRDKDDKNDLQEWIDAIRSQAGALDAVAAGYGPIIQSAIDTGVQGKTHRITVSERAESKLTGEEIFVVVSEHTFMVDDEPLKLSGQMHEGLDSHG